MPLHQWMITGRAKQVYKALKKTEWLDKDKVREFQEFKLQRLINHCYQHVPYYKEIFEVNSLKFENIFHAIRNEI